MDSFQPPPPLSRSGTVRTYLYHAQTVQSLFPRLVRVLSTVTPRTARIVFMAQLGTVRPVRGAHRSRSSSRCRQFCYISLMLLRHRLHCIARLWNREILIFFPAASFFLAARARARARKGGAVISLWRSPDPQRTIGPPGSTLESECCCLLRVLAHLFVQLLHDTQCICSPSACHLQQSMNLNCIIGQSKVGYTELYPPQGGG